ncbi:MAG TPA: hypothetical protein VF120_14765 [Ktedonobacterales bacterium]
MGNDDERDAQTPAQTGQSLDVILFDGEQAKQRIRRVWYDGRWFFSVIDVIGFVTDSKEPRKYWTAMKARIEDEGFRELSAKCRQLKMTAPDGKQRLTDAADRETLLRILQSVSSPKVEWVKQWLARVGNERMDEMEDPSLALERARKLYARQGYADDWIDKRLQGQIIRDELTQEWADRGAKEGKEFARLTDTIHHGTFEVTTAEHKEFKGLKSRQNLRDSMTTFELLLTGLGEETAKTLHQVHDSAGFNALQSDCEEAGEVGGAARLDTETRTGRSVVSPVNHQQLRQERQRELQPPLLDLPEGHD